MDTRPSRALRLPVASKRLGLEPTPARLVPTVGDAGAEHPLARRVRPPHLPLPAEPPKVTLEAARRDTTVSDEVDGFENHAVQARPFCDGLCLAGSHRRGSTDILEGLAVSTLAQQRVI